MDIREAQTQDTEAALALVRRSIVELCREDHLGDPLTLEGWLCNKTPANMRAWIESPSTRVYATERDGRLAGVGAFTAAGDLILLYVDPEARFCGVSKALLGKIEEEARAMRLPRLRLTTSFTARRFFLERGYEVEEEEGDIFDSADGCELRKEL